MATSAAAGNGSAGRLRNEVAACTRLLNSLGILGYSGHVSARLDGGDTFLIQPQERSRAALRPEDLIVCNLDGQALSAGKPPSELFLHGEIYRARPDVHAVAHFHHDPTNVFTLVEDVELRPVKNHAVRWQSGIPVHPDPAHVHSGAHGRGVAATLGPHHAMQIRAHGQIVTAEHVRAVFIDSVHFVENAEAMYRAATLGRVKALTPAEIESFTKGLRREHHVRKLWTYYTGLAVADGTLPAEWLEAEERDSAASAAA